MAIGKSPLRLGLIGVGKHGRRYAVHIRDDFPGSLRLVAIARRENAKAKETAREFGCRAYTDYRKLIDEEEIDALVVVVPPADHVEIVSAALRAGLPVLLEKPTTISLNCGRGLLEILASRPIPVMAAQTLRYNAVVRAITAALPQIGALHSVVLTQRFEEPHLDWLDDPSKCGGGIVLHTGVHSFDLLRVLTGLEAETVACHLSSVRTRQTEDNFAASVSLGGGTVLATISGSRAAGGRTGYIELAGEEGTLVGDHVGHRLHKVVGTTAIPIPLPDPVPTVREVLKDFGTALRTGAPMPIPLEDGLRAVAIADACYRAARSGSPARVEAFS